METRIGNWGQLMLGLVGGLNAFPPFFFVVEFRITRLNLSCVFSLSLLLGHVILLDLIGFSWLDLSFSLEMLMSI